MIRVTITRGNDGYLKSLEVQGHDESAPSGQNIVCAGTSAVIQSFLIGALDVLEIEARVAVKKGSVFFEPSASCCEEKKKGMKLLLETMLATLEKLEERYTGAVEVIDSRGV